MNICIPVESDQGLASEVYGHFGSAPYFLIVDTETGTCRCLPNAQQHHAHGMCQPVAALGNEPVDGIVVGGIGMGALLKLQAAGYQVYQSRFATVDETLAAHREGRLPLMSIQHVCGGHGPGHGCGHDH